MFDETLIHATMAYNKKWKPNQSKNAEEWLKSYDFILVTSFNYNL